MARRKKQYISDDDPDTSEGSQSDLEGEERVQGDYDDEDADERAERLRFTDPYGRKRQNKRKRNGKEEALYGVFNEGDEEETTSRNGSGRGNKALRRTQVFVPSSTSHAHEREESPSHDRPMDLADAVPLPDAVDVAVEDASSDESDDDGSDGSDESTDEEERRKKRIPRNRDEEEEAVDESVLSNALSAGGSGEQRGGIGARPRGGIGSMARAAAVSLVPETPAMPSLSPANTEAPVTAEAGRSISGTPEPGDAAAGRARRAFLGSASGTSTPTGMGAFRKAAAPISKQEQKHFSKLASQGGFGFKLLSKMGWSAGSGLGASGEGIVTPIESKLRPKAMGLAYEGFKERTKQSEQEERRRKGEEVSDDDEDLGRRRKAKGKGKEKDQNGDKPPATPVWKEPKPRKAKVQHMTYEQIVASSSASASTSAVAGVGQIYDLTGKELPSSALSASAHVHDVPTSDAAKLPELRHNLALIVDIAKSDLDNLAREGRAVEERRLWLWKEEERIKMAAFSNNDKIVRLLEITAATANIQKIAASLVHDDRPAAQQLALFQDPFDALLGSATPEEYENYRLDEAIVGAISPIMKRAWQTWDPVQEPTAYLNELKKLRKMLRLQKRDKDLQRHQQVELFGSSSYTAVRNKEKVDKNMTAFESMMWTLWMPRLRSAINNSWNPAYPSPIITLFSSWQSSGLLSRFISDNILDQLILPKIRKAISDWTPPRKGKDKAGASLHHIVFPWLEHAGERMDEILDEAKRRVRGWLKTWKVRDGVPDGLQAWRDVLPATEWDNLTLQHVVPQLSSQLRDRFVVNPRQQDLTPLTLVLAWRPLLRSSILSQILEIEFFPKFLDALYTWLVAPTVNYGQVADWYKWWKQQALAGYETLPGVERGFAKALDTMNQAMALGDDAKYRLKRPGLGSATSTSSTTSANKPDKAVSSTKPDQSSEVTFRSVVQDIAAENNLVFMPTGRSHETSGMPLFRISSGIDGKSGITIYLQGDVVYAPDSAGTGWKPISVQDMVARASRSS